VSPENERLVRIAQISDLHIRNVTARDAREFEALLDDCIVRVNAIRPDIVIATGDLTDGGEIAEYERLRERVRGLLTRYYLLPGNHDRRDALRRVFHDHAYLFQNAAHISYAIDAGALRVIALDSTKPGRPGGYLDSSRLAWLQEQLRIDPQRPVLLALHHPPFRAGVWPMDWLGFLNVRELARIVTAHSQIRCVVSGHVHSARWASWAGTFACTSPSTKTQRLLIRERGAFPAFRVASSGFLVHTFAPDGGVTTQLHRMDGTVEALPH
jgi:3',5'-cyclic-AMP phosphodiesterase